MTERERLLPFQPDSERQGASSPAQQLPFTGERVVPGATPIYLVWAHAARYEFVREGVRGKVVLDAGCGEGYGAHYLAQHAKRMVGVDVSGEAVGHAQARYRRPNLHYAEMDCAWPSFADASFDVVCSFEVIEHLSDMGQFVREVRRILKPGGVFYVSTPNGALDTLAGANPYHEKELTQREFYDILAPHFPAVDVYGQFCLRPLREYLFVRSTRLYLRSSLYRRLIKRLAPLYLAGDHVDPGSSDPNWVEQIDPGTFIFSRHAVERASYFLAVCRTEPCGCAPEH